MRQGAIAAFPFAVFVCETVTNQTPAAGSAMVSQTVSTAGGTQQARVMVLA
jgi:hypothetical protein